MEELQKPPAPPVLESELTHLRSENDLLRRKTEEWAKAFERLAAERDDLRREAQRDLLTGLFNRRYFEDRLRQEIDRCDRDGSHVSLVLVDVNDLKAINDSAGHPAGDNAIRWGGAFLSESVRQADIACRTGGDEFVVLLPATGLNGAERMVERMRARLRQMNLGNTRPIEVAIGAATRLAAETAHDLLAAADAAMYADKAAQKGQKGNGA